MLYRGLLHKMLSRTWHKHASKTWYRSPYINRIVVCLGGSNPCASEIALSNVFGLVSSWNRNESSEVSIHGYHVPSKHETNTDDYRKRFNTLASEFPQLDAAFDVAEATKDIRDTLMEYCSEAEPDLVAIGTGGSTHYLKLTSLVEYVVRESPCDVLIVREHNTNQNKQYNGDDYEMTGSDEDNGNVAEFIEPSVKCDGKAILPGLHNDRPMKVLVCFGSNNWEDSIEALRAAIRLCRPGDEVQLVTTPDFSAGGNAIHVVAPPDEGTSIEDVLMGDLKEVMDDHQTDDLILSAKVIPASPLPAAALCEYAESENVDIMATGYGGHSHLFHPNSFPFYIAHKAHCSVLVARQPTSKEIQQGEEEKEEHGNIDSTNEANNNKDDELRMTEPMNVKSDGSSSHTTTASASTVGVHASS
ncbi:hypothetical protein FOL47_005527 [Perkinsus chesapeaki]|uniref:UspA domain-containing protein n=1 Tax=Perkinsus chesapeaki TaxID=330153 RepID=A0A7J6LX33_PERCH|nr:hypothetical protein FOL47_005527 [Perkinsus chesapeaki]